MAGELQHHRRVVPAHQLRAGAVSHEFVQQGSQLRRLIGGGKALGQHGRGDRHAMVGGDPQLERGLHARLEPRLLPIDHQPTTGEAAHQMLRTLENKIPAQM